MTQQRFLCIGTERIPLSEDEYAAAEEHYQQLPPADRLSLRRRLEAECDRVSRRVQAWHGTLWAGFREELNVAESRLRPGCNPPVDLNDLTETVLELLDAVRYLHIERNKPPGWYWIKTLDTDGNRNELLSVFPHRRILEQAIERVVLAHKTLRDLLDHEPVLRFLSVQRPPLNRFNRTGASLTILIRDYVSLTISKLQFGGLVEVREATSPTTGEVLTLEQISAGCPVAYRIWNGPIHIPGLNNALNDLTEHRFHEEAWDEWYRSNVGPLPWFQDKGNKVAQDGSKASSAMIDAYQGSSLATSLTSSLNLLKDKARCDLLPRLKGDLRKVAEILLNAHEPIPIRDLAFEIKATWEREYKLRWTGLQYRLRQKLIEVDLCCETTDWRARIVENSSAVRRSPPKRGE